MENLDRLGVLQSHPTCISSSQGIFKSLWPLTSRLTPLPPSSLELHGENERSFVPNSDPYFDNVSNTSTPDVLPNSEPKSELCKYAAPPSTARTRPQFAFSKLPHGNGFKLFRKMSATWAATARSHKAPAGERIPCTKHNTPLNRCPVTVVRSLTREVVSLVSRYVVTCPGRMPANL